MLVYIAVAFALGVMAVGFLIRIEQHVAYIARVIREAQGDD